MATILQFRRDAEPIYPVATGELDGTTAEIIIFPGVRIERCDDDDVSDIADVSAEDRSGD